MNRESFTFCRFYIEALESLDDEQFGRVLRAVCKYALYGQETKLSGIDKTLFKLIKGQLDTNIKRFENGSKGGRKKVDKIKGRESYNEIIDCFDFSKPVEDKVRAFIRNSQLNGKKHTNDELDSILVQLDLYYHTDTDKIRALDDAIRGNYFALRRMVVV